MEIPDVLGTSSQRHYVIVVITGETPYQHFLKVFLIIYITTTFLIIYYACISDLYTNKSVRLSFTNFPFLAGMIYA